MRYIDDIELRKINEFARRIRGEIFFSNKWILCEGATEYALIHAFFEKEGFPLDSNGIAVIDCQNGGSPGAFVSLAEQLGFPWVLFCDGDPAGVGYVSQAIAQGLSRQQVMKKTVQLEQDDIEEALVACGHGKEICEVLRESGLMWKEIDNDQDLIKLLRNKKTEYSGAIAQWIYAGKQFSTPGFIEDLISKVRTC